MKTDINGCSTCPIGQEQHEEFTIGYGRRKKTMVQYDYRHTDGELYSTCAPTLQVARQRKDEWLKNKLDKQ